MDTHKYWNVLELRENYVTISAVLQVMDAWNCAECCNFFFVPCMCVLGLGTCREPI